MAHTNKVYPGILCNGVEFFVQGDTVKAFTQGRTIDFTELAFSHIQMLREEIEKDDEVKVHLLRMHPTSEFKRLEQFTRCRFGGLDFTPDLDGSGVQKGEYWDCPLRGKCASEGVLCKAPEYKGVALNKDDISLVQKISTNATNDVIAQEMNLPLGSFHVKKKALYNKLKIQTKQESTIIAHRLNLI